MGWWLGLAPATLEFWVRFPNERNQGKQAHPVLKYRVPHGSHPSPRKQLCTRSCSNKHTHLMRRNCVSMCDFNNDCNLFLRRGQNLNSKSVVMPFELNAMHVVT